MIQKPEARGQKPDQDIDLGLAVLAVVSPPHTEWSQSEIARVCGCCRTTIFNIEKAALAKLRKKLGPFLTDTLASDL